MRMCETEAGTWLLGSHEGDWSYRPLMTRQYILRSEDQGQSWELLPDGRHGGWHAGGFNRMDELRPIDLGAGEVYAMARTPEGISGTSAATTTAARGQTHNRPR